MMNLAKIFEIDDESRRIALQDAYDACDRLIAPKDKDKLSQGWIIAREKCLAAIRDLMAKPTER